MPLPTPPAQGYVICATPRCGSTLLCHMLRATGVAGHPESWFHRPDLAEWCATYGVSIDPALDPAGAMRGCAAQGITAGQAATQVFGLRLQYKSLAYLMDQLAAAYPDAADDPARLDAAFGPLRYIYLRREDKLAQAISRVRAEQSGLWHQAPDGTELNGSLTRKPPLDRARLAEVIAELEHERGWMEWFARHKITPFALDYRPWQRTRSTPVRRLALFAPAGRGRRPVTVPTVKLADSVNAAWAKAYRDGAWQRTVW